MMSNNIYRWYFLRIAIGIALALLLTGSIAASTEPVLLASLNDTSGECWSSSDSMKVVFGLNINTAIMWDGFEHTDGDTGIYYLDSENNPDFANISIYLTNNQNDLVWSLDRTVGGGYCGRGYYEEDWIKGNPDLSGYYIDFIRLIIHNLSIKPHDGGTLVMNNKTWEFWGHSTPTPTPPTPVPEFPGLSLMMPIAGIMLVALLLIAQNKRDK